MDLGHWTLSEGVEITEETFGFIYLIECKTTGKKYIGKKQCKSRIKRKPLKGKKRNRIDSKESDWKTYTSSSNELNELIKKYGKENVIKINKVLYYAKTRKNSLTTSKETGMHGEGSRIRNDYKLKSCGTQC